jgi:hypothetical protein
LSIKGQIRQKSREQWLAEIQDIWTDVRIWIQENGEKAAVICLVLGIFVVLFYKLFIFLALIGVLAAFFVWFVAIPEDELRAQSIALQNSVGNVPHDTVSGGPAATPSDKAAGTVPIIPEPPLGKEPASSVNAALDSIEDDTPPNQQH